MNLQITSRARSKLQEYLDNSALSAPLAAIVRIAEPEGMLEPKWEVGFYEAGKVPSEWNILVADINVNVDPYWHHWLNGKTIDYEEDKFTIC